MTHVTLNRASETQAYQQRLLAVQETLSAAYWRKLLARFSKRAAAQYALNGEAGLVLALETFKEEAATGFEKTWRAALGAFSAQTAKLASKRRVLTKIVKAKKTTVIDEVVVDWTNKFLAEKVQGVGRTLAKEVKRIISGGVNDGLTIPEISKQLNDTLLSKTPYEAMRIARTEVHGAAMAGMDAGAAATGLELKKQWLAAEDDRTRPAHADADGQTVGMNESFNVDGEALRFPGDPYGSAENVIQCRCTTLYIPIED